MESAGCLPTVPTPRVTLKYCGVTCLGLGTYALDPEAGEVPGRWEKSPSPEAAARTRAGLPWAQEQEGRGGKVCSRSGVQGGGGRCRQAGPRSGVREVQRRERRLGK